MGLLHSDDNLFLEARSMMCLKKILRIFLYSFLPLCSLFCINSDGGLNQVERQLCMRNCTQQALSVRSQGYMSMIYHAFHGNQPKCHFTSTSIIPLFLLPLVSFFPESHLHISQSLIPQYVLCMNTDLPDHTFNVKETAISVSVSQVNPFPTLYAKKLRVSNSLQSTLGLIMLNESYHCIWL